ncbi:MAG: stage III sporulation protein AA, partial [Syntrophomonadaceae bacterium]|nr:stage III sporulation protein AA [Syntrophomonadaceae bacterium]
MIYPEPVENRIQQQIVPYLSSPLRSLLSSLPVGYLRNLEEIRLRLGRPLLLKIGDEDYSVKEPGRLTRSCGEGYVVGKEDVQRTVAAISESSLYALEEELKRGFI